MHVRHACECDGAGALRSDLHRAQCGALDYALAIHARARDGMIDAGVRQWWRRGVLDGAGAARRQWRLDLGEGA